MTNSKQRNELTAALISQEQILEHRGGSGGGRLSLLIWVGEGIAQNISDHRWQKYLAQVISQLLPSGRAQWLEQVSASLLLPSHPRTSLAAGSPSGRGKSPPVYQREEEAVLDDFCPRSLPAAEAAGQERTVSQGQVDITQHSHGCRT